MFIIVMKEVLGLVGLVAAVAGIFYLATVIAG